MAFETDVARAILGPGEGTFRVRVAYSRSTFHQGGNTGTAAAVAVGDPIGLVRDFSGNNNHLVNAGVGWFDRDSQWSGRGDFHFGTKPATQAEVKP